MGSVEVRLGTAVLTCRVTTGAPGPLVVLLHGLGLSAESWGAVQDQLDGRVRSVSYDRAALLSAFGSRGAVTAAEQARQLRLLLAAAGLDGPYVLVGHSWGAVVARAFADGAEDVQSLVLVDGTHEELASLSDPAFRFVQCAARAVSWLVPHAAARELAGLPGSLRAARPAAVPVWAVTGGRASSRRQRRVRADVASVYARIATTHVVAPRSGHLVPVEAPEVVVSCVLDAVQVPALEAS